MSDAPVRYAIASPARWGRLLLDASRDSTTLEFAGVWSRDPANAAEVVGKYGGRSFASFEELLADETVEAVLLPTPHFLHHPQAMAAFAAGKHVFVEKPIANSLEEAEAMRRASEERRLTLAVDHPGRRTGAAREAKRLLADGALGTVVMAVVLHAAPVLSRGGDDWKFSAEAVPGGPLDQLGVHYADLLQYLFGPVRRVSGFYTRAVTPFTAPDAAVATYEFASGVLASHLTSQVTPYASQLIIYGTLGALQVNRFGQELLWQDVVNTQAAQAGNLALQPIPFEGPHPYTTALTEALEEFAGCIRRGGAPEVGASEGIAALRMVRAVMEAHETGRTVELDEERR